MPIGTRAGSHRRAPGPEQAEPVRTGSRAAMVAWWLFQLASCYILFDTLRASSNLAMVWNIRIEVLGAVAVAWLAGVRYLVASARWRLPRLWYVTPLVWSVALLAILAHVPQTVRFRVWGQGAFSDYRAANPAGQPAQAVKTTIGGYRILAVEQVGEVYVFHAEPVNDVLLPDQSTCASVVWVPPAQLDGWRSVLDRPAAHHLAGDWWLLNYGTRGVWCPAYFDVYLRP